MKWADAYLPPDNRSVLEQVAAERGINPSIMLGPSRTHPVVMARDEAMGRYYEAGMSLVEIGRMFNRDHSTVRQGIRRAHA